jgi:Dolichyl-phosphate-mannose-protein mannosyltransferase
VAWGMVNYLPEVPEKMNKYKEFILVILMIAMMGIPRLVGLGNFVSVDEPYWLQSSANFYYALGQRQFENTVYGYHPAVTTMWIITVGMLAYFPEYRALGQGYLKPGKYNLFLPAHGKDLLQLLIVSRGIQVFVIIVLLLMVYFLLRRIFGRLTAFFTTSLISLSPFFLGQSRLLNHEAMLGLFLLISLLGMLVYLYIEKNGLLLVLSACAAALGQLTKSSGLPLIPLIMLVVLVYALGLQHAKLGKKLLEAFKTIGFWLIALVFFYFLFWPGMWVAPGKMLYVVYGNALGYMFQGMTLEAMPTLDPSSFRLGSLSNGLQIYLSDLMWRTAVVTWLGFMVGIWVAVVNWRRKSDKNYQLIFIYSMMLAAAFVLLFSIERGRQPPHYILTSYICMDLIAGLGISRAFDYLAQRFPNIMKNWTVWALSAVILALQLVSAVGFYPYYITYYNPVVGALLPQADNPTLNGTGYGVGADQAAAYLSQKAGASQMSVLAAYGEGSFSYYFPGKTTPMNDLDLTDPVIVGILKDSQYAVVDYYNQKKIGLLTGLVGVKPEKIIWINGFDFLNIYRASDLLAGLNTAPH